MIKTTKIVITHIRGSSGKSVPHEGVICNSVDNGIDAMSKK